MIFNKDCMEVMKELADESIDLIVTDPPYRLTTRGGVTTMGGMYTTDAINSGKVFDNNDIDCEEYAPEFYRLLKNGSHCYVMCNNVNLINMLNVFTSVGFHFIRSLVWDKCNKICGTYYMSQFEYILFFRKGVGIPINNPQTPDILSVPVKKMKAVGGGNLHDTEKPVQLMKILIENSSKVENTVLDPFMGIGATGVACKHLNREFIGCEINPKYFAVAEQRINASNNISATKSKLF